MTRRPPAFESPGPSRAHALAELQTSINAKLDELFRSNEAKGREHLADVLIQWVEDFVCDTLPQSGFSFGRIDYGGDVNYENSEQVFGDGDPMGTGIVLSFRGFNCKVEWVDAQPGTQAEGPRSARSSA